MPDTQAGLGHNQPPAEFSTLDPEMLGARLERDHAALLRRIVEIKQGCERFPGKIEDDDTAKTMVDFVAEQLSPLISDIEKTHTAEKRPFLLCGRKVDEFFLRRRDDLKVFYDTITRRGLRWQQAKQAEQRRVEAEARQRAEEARLRAEAEQRRLEEEARAAAAAGDRETAVGLGVMAEAEASRAQQAEAIVNAPAEPVRLHGDYGGTGFVRGTWTYEIEDLALLPPGYWSPDDDIIRAAINRGERNIPGLRIYREEKLSIRRS